MDWWIPVALTHYPERPPHPSRYCGYGPSAGAGALSGEPMTPNAHAALAILALVALVLLSGCGTTGDLSVMHDIGGDPDTEGQNPVCTLEVEKQIASRVTAKYEHVSWCSSGIPFNDNPESTIDAIGIGVRIW